MKKEEFCEKLICTIQRYLKEEFDTEHIQDQNGMLIFHHPLSGILRTLKITICVDSEGFGLFCTLPVGCDPQNPEQWDAVSKFLNYVNLFLPHGHFQLYHRSGNVLFRDYCRCANPHPSQQVLFHSIAYVISTCQEYSYSILRRLFMEKSKAAKEPDMDISTICRLIELEVDHLEAEMRAEAAEMEAGIDYDEIFGEDNEQEWM